MGRLLTGSIDLSKISKDAIVSTDKDGKPFANGAKYINVNVWVNDDVDKYGNIASVQQYIDKDSKPYIGNLKEFEKKGGEQPVTADGENELPF